MPSARQAGIDFANRRIPCGMQMTPDESISAKGSLRQMPASRFNRTPMILIIN